MTRFALTTLLLLTCAVAQADTVRLRDGQRLEGEIVQRSAKELVLKTRFGLLVIPAQDVRRVESARAVIVARPLSKSALNKLRLLHLRAKRLRLMKRFAKSAERYGELLALRKTDAEALYWRATCHARLGQTAEAIAGLERAALAGFSDFERLRRAPELASLRTAPAFTQLVEQRGALLRKAAQQAPARLVSWLKLRGALGQYRVDPAPSLGLTFVYADSAAFALARKEFTGWVQSLRRDLFRAKPEASIYVVLLAAEDTKALLTKEAASFDALRNTLVCSPLPGGVLARSGPTLRALVQALHAEDQASRNQRHPAWLGAGLVDLFGAARLREGTVVPSPSGRLAALRKQPALPWGALLTATERTRAGRDQARTLLQHLHAQGKLTAVYEACGARAEGEPLAALEAATGTSVAALEAARQRWLAAQAPPTLPFAGLLTRDGQAGLRVTYVQPESGAAKASLGEGDVLVAVDGAFVRSRGDLDDLLASRAVGETIVAHVQRGGQVFRVKVELSARPDGPIGPNRGAAPYLGVAVTTASGRVVVREVRAGSPAARVGVAAGDAIRSIDGAEITSVRRWLRALRLKTPGQTSKLVLERAGKALEVQVEFAALGAAPKTTPAPKPPARKRPARRF